MKIRVCALIQAELQRLYGVTLYYNTVVPMIVGLSILHEPKLFGKKFECRRRNFRLVS